MAEALLSSTALSPEVPDALAVDFIDVDEVCRIVGGSKPVNRSTIYRGIAAGRWPKPVRIGPNVSRWVRSEWLAIIKASLAERDQARAA